MSADADAVEEEQPEEQAPDPEPEPEETEDDRPAIEDDERADVDLDDLDLDTDAIEEEAGAGADEQDDDEGDTSDDENTESTAQPTVPDGESWGDQYVMMLSLLLGEIAESSDGETSKDAEAIEELARSPPVELDDAVDQWLAESGMEMDFSPGKQVAIGTAGLALVIVLTETDVAQDAISDLTDDLNLQL
ncbi:MULTISPECIES: hypothetical protein [Halomicrobium]|uniref:Uncharacterized protein n=2 Tax=Halomicrobium mukohataei TaxID=57705 RepID=C7P418_HALMD|nr:MULTISPECIES: hypothetical protein [Halomicrobium]ACV47840.1 conserved hypothetical protein [Halomicrobium mukohataei DSM 12286]QCD66284.1 hypothetical protein E5139_11750 [Halomicrobium mukohataei]QFR21090.1 hypothetical protein GBQ70_11745 [Halomicrobium sp. ZPS1]